VLPFNYAIPKTPKRFWSSGEKFYRYQPDFLIALCNQVLFMGLIGSVFFLARRLFDAQVAWVSAVLVLGTEMFWRFSVSGLSTILLVLIFMGLVWCLVFLEEELREPKWGSSGAFLLAGLAGALVGLGALTRYSYGWLILPVLVFVLVYSGTRRGMLGALVVLGCSIVLLPWLVTAWGVDPGILRQKLDLSKRMRTNPYGTLAVAVGAGYLLGGGLFSSTTRRLVGVGMKVGLRVGALALLKQQLSLMTGDADLYCPPSVLRLFVARIHGAEALYKGIAAYEAAQERLADAVSDFERSLPFRRESADALDGLPEPQANMTKDEFKKMVETCKEYIRAGDAFQIVPSQRFSLPFTLPPLSLYRSLRRINPSPFLIFFDYGDFSIVGSSPEILVRLRDNIVTIRPLAGI
jgi:hypothetical protein